MSLLPESPIERLFGPCDRRLSRADSHQSFSDQTDGSIVIAVTPPTVLRMPTAFCRLSCDEISGFHSWISGRGTIDECLPYITSAQREILLNGMYPLPPEELESTL